jgi:hypothetical protein
MKAVLKASKSCLVKRRVD